MMDKWLVTWDEQLKARTKGFHLGSGAWGCFEDLPPTANGAIYRRHYVTGPNPRYEWKLVEAAGKPAENTGATAA